MTHKILVPLDGSPGSETVLATAEEVARAEGASVHLLHVAPLPEVLRSGDRIVAYADQESARVEHEGLAYLKEVSAGLRGVEVEQAVRFGEPGEQIVEEATSAGADLIAMATHRRAGVRRILKGSVAEQVRRATRIPVLLVPYGARSAA